MKPSFTACVMQFFRDNPARWIEATRLEPIGGRQAWRSRVAEARLRFKANGEGTIVNRQRRQTVNGQAWTLSEYCYFPKGCGVTRDERAVPHDMNRWDLQ